MKTKIFFILSLAALLTTSCSEYSNLLKNPDADYRYEAAKQYFAQGEYAKASMLLGDQLAMRKGTPTAEESLYLMAMSEFCNHDYESAASYFKKYYQSYPRGLYAEEARFNTGKALFESVPNPRLDQSATVRAISEFQNFLDYYPETKLRPETEKMIFALQDKLVEKEYLAAKLYFDLGDYFGNCGSGESNYNACVITAQNALKDYPYSSRREDFSIMVLRAKYGLAQQSVEAKKADRYRETIDEYYGFANEYPESKYLKEAQKMLANSERIVNGKENKNSQQ